MAKIFKCNYLLMFKLNLIVYETNELEQNLILRDECEIYICNLLKKKYSESYYLKSLLTSIIPFQEY